MLIECLRAINFSIMAFAFIHWSVSWRVEVLVEGLLSVECPIALLTFEEVGWGIEVLLQCSLTSIARCLLLVGALAAPSITAPMR